MDVNEMKFAGYSNPNRNTGGRSMQEYEAGASWIMRQLATAMEEYGEDVCSHRHYFNVLYFPLMYFFCHLRRYTRGRRGSFHRVSTEST